MKKKQKTRVYLHFFLVQIDLKSFKKSAFKKQVSLILSILFYISNGFQRISRLYFQEVNSCRSQKSINNDLIVIINSFPDFRETVKRKKNSTCIFHEFDLWLTFKKVDHIYTRQSCAFRKSLFTRPSCKQQMHEDGMYRRMSK